MIRRIHDELLSLSSGGPATGSDAPSHSDAPSAAAPSGDLFGDQSHNELGEDVLDQRDRISTMVEHARVYLPDLPADATPADFPAASIAPNALTCLECGERVILLTAHLNREHQLTPQSYRARWMLPKDYPMTPADYRASRVAHAARQGLGTKVRRKALREKS